MSDYTLENGKHYKVTSKDTGEFISVGQIEEGNVLSTIHDVTFITEAGYAEYLHETEYDGALPQ